MKRKKRLIILFVSLFICMCLYAKPCLAIEARAGDGEINIQWIAPTKNEDGTPLTDLAGYYIYRAQDPGDVLERLNEEPLRGICYCDTGLINGITYFYAVSAVDFSGNESKKSPIISATPNILPPERFRVKPGDEKVYLFWEPYAKSPVKGYNVYRKSASEQKFIKLTDLPGQDVYYTDSPVSNGIAYFYKVSCVGIDGIEGLPSQELGVTPMAVIPGEPSSVQVRYVKTPGGANYVEISWDKSEEEGIAGYRIYRRLLTERDFTLLTTAPVNETNYNDTTALPDKGYLYSVVSVTERGMESQYPKEAQCFTAPVYISSFTQDTANKAKKAGDKVCFCLRGEPGGSAYCRINGLGDDYLFMQEIEEGLYKTCIDITPDMSLEEVEAIGILEDVTGNKTSILAEGTLTIDNIPPNPLKGANAKWDTGTVYITWSPPEGEYSAYDISRQEEGNEKVAEEERHIRKLPADATSYHDGDIKPGRVYSYRIYVLDRAGNMSAPFLLPPVNIPDQEGIPIIEKIAENTAGMPQKTGDRIEVTLFGEEGCQASFFIPDILNEQVRMSETAPGNYSGSYIIRAEDKSDQCVLKVCLKDDLGHINCLNARSGLRINSESKDLKEPLFYRISDNAFEIAGFSGHLVPGNILEVTLSAEAGCTAVFTILPADISPDENAGTYKSFTTKGPILNEMTEDQDYPGIYKGSYKITWQDSSSEEAYVWVCLSDWAGNKAWQRSAEPFSIDTRPRIKVKPDKNVLWADQESQSLISVEVKDANEDPVENHLIALTLSTTDEYTGVSGGGDFGRKIDGSMSIDFDQVTDSWGETEAEYKSGFAAKTALIVAKDLTTGHSGVGYILNIVKAQTDIQLDPPPTMARFLKAAPYQLILTADPDRLTADGLSSAWITAQLADLDGTPINKEEIMVSFYLDGKNGTLAHTQILTDAYGQASTRYTAGIIRGTVTITAICNSEDEFDGGTGKIKLSLMSDAPAKIELTADPNSLIADGINQSLVKVWVADINNNPVQQAMVEFSVLQEEKGTLSIPTMATDFNGWAECMYTSPDLTAGASGIATIITQVTSKVPEEEELALALGTVFVPHLYSEMEEEEEVKILEWLHKKGDEVKQGAPVIRLETQKGEFLLNAPVSGELANIRIHRGERAKLGQTLGQILADESYIQQY